MLRMLPVLVPFDLRRYAAIHFAKISAQTRLMLDAWVEHAGELGLPADSLTELRRALEPAGPDLAG